MDLQLAGKRALVTGSTAGIGFAAAVALYQEGASVTINGRTIERVNAAIERIKKLPAIGSPSLNGVAADLSNAEGAAKLIASLPDVDILVNNTGIFEPKAFEEIPDADWFRFFETNVMSGVRLSRHYLPRMKAKNWGRILFLSSESAVQVPPEMIHYGMTKTAQLAISRGLAESTAGTNVTVNAVLPGPTGSEGVAEFVDNLAKQQGVDRKAVEADFFKHVRPSSLIQRFAGVEEVASMIAYLSSPLASATNGAAIRVEGGILRSVV